MLRPDFCINCLVALLFVFVDHSSEFSTIMPMVTNETRADKNDTHVVDKVAEAVKSFIDDTPTPMLITLAALVLLIIVLLFLYGCKKFGRNDRRWGGGDMYSMSGADLRQSSSVMLRGSGSGGSLQRVGSSNSMIYIDDGDDYF